MKVTDLDYPIEKLKLQKLDLMIRRVSGKKRLQNVIGCDGQEGFGKSTITAADAYYMAYTLKRPLYLFFDIEKLTQHALENEDNIYIWDDAALSALSLEAYNSVIIKFIKTILLARKRRHTYFINIQEIFRLKEPLVSRMVGLTHVYSADEYTIGRFAYYNKKQLQYLYDVWGRKKLKLYGRYKTFMGTFPNVLYKVFDEKEYEGLKDEAILSIGKDKGSKKVEVLNKLRWMVAHLPEKIDIDNKKLAELFETTEMSISRWRRLDVWGDGLVLTHNQNENIKNKGYVMPRTNYLSESNKKTKVAPAIKR